MTEERLDIVIKDAVADTVAPKLVAIGNAAGDAYTQLKLMQQAIATIKDSGIRALTKAQVDLTVATSRQSIAQERAAAAAYRTEAAQARAVLQANKAATENERLNLITARVSTEQERAAAVTERAAIARERMVASSERNARSMEKEGDAAVKLFTKIDQLKNQQRGQSYSQGIFEANTSAPSGKSAKASASVFTAEAQAMDQAAKATEALAVRANQLRAAIDPLDAAQQRYNRELAEANALLAAGAITTQTHQQAVALSTGALDRATQANKRMGDQAKLTRFQLLTMQYTINDVVASLASGANPMTILLQQGGQVTQAWGGLIPTLKAAGGAILSVTGLVVGLASGVALAGYAFLKGREETEEYNKAIINTGNYAGKTTQQLADMAVRVSANADATRSASADAVTQLAQAGNIATENYERIASVAVRAQSVTGAAVAETVKQFNELGKDPVKASIKLNETTHFLTVAVYQQVKALADQGRMLEAASVAQNAYARVLEQRLPQLKENLGFLETAAKATSGAFKGMWDAALGVGRPGDPAVELADKIAAARAAMAKASAPGAGIVDQAIGADAKKRLESLMQQQAAQSELERIQRRSAQTLSEQAKATEAQIRVDAIYESHLSKKEKMTRALAEAETAYKAVQQTPANKTQYEQVVRNIREQYKEEKKPALKDSAFTAFMEQFSEMEAMAKREAEMNAVLTNSEKLRIKGTYDLAEAYRNKKIGVVELDIAQRALDKTTGEMKAAEDEIRLAKEATAAHNEYIAALKRSTTEAEDKNKTLTDEAAAYKYAIDNNIALAKAIEMVTIKRLEEEQAKQMSYGDDKAAALLEREIAARRAMVQGTDERKAAQELNRIYEATSGALNDLKVKQVALDQAYAAGLINLKQYQDSLRDIEKQTFELKQTMGTDTFADRLAFSFRNNMSTMTDDLLAFTKTGELNFENFVNNALNDLLRLQLQQQVMPGLQAGGAAAMDWIGGLGQYFIGGSFDVGTPYVPEDMIARIHKGERIITASENRNYSGGGGNNTVVNVIESPGNGGKQTQRTENNVNIIDILVERVSGTIAGNISQGSGVVPSAMEAAYGLNRTAGSY